MRSGSIHAGRALALVALLGGTAVAGPALDDGAKKGDSPTEAPATEPKVDANTGAVLTATDKEPEVEYGVAVRLRNVMLPKGELELFLDRAGGGASNLGLGAELIRRRGNVELQLGFEYEHVQPGAGIWIQKNKPVPANEADYVIDPSLANSHLGWFTAEFTFLNHAPITKWLSFRYGGGAGLGIVTGSLKHYNVVCAATASNANPDPGCVPNTLAGASGQQGQGSDSDGRSFQQPVAYSLPPVFPVVNAIVGFQIKPMDKMTINIEGGIRTLLFFGMSAAYFF